MSTTSQPCSELLPDIPAERRMALAGVMLALFKAGFGYNSTPVEGVISLQRAWQGPREDLVMVDGVTLDTRGQALAVREGPTGRPVWGPERGPWSAVVDAFLAQSAPHGFVQVVPRAMSTPVRLHRRGDA